MILLPTELEHKVIAWLQIIAVSTLTLIMIETIHTAYAIKLLQALEQQTELMQQQEAEAETTAAKQPTATQTADLHITIIKAKITAYTARRQETDADPGRTAIMEKPIPGWTCAVSRDLAHWLGGRIWIEGVGVRKVNDLMNERFKRRVDVLVGKSKEANQVAADERRVVFLGKG